MNVKRICSFILILLCGIIFCGCATIESQRIVYPSGIIVDLLSIEIDGKSIMSKGHTRDDVDNLLANIKADMEVYYLQPLRTKKAAYMLSVSSEEATKVETAVNIGLAQQYVDEAKNIYQIYVKIEFESSDYLTVLYGNSDEDEEKEPIIESNLFISKYIVQRSGSSFSGLAEQFGGLENVEVNGKNFYDTYHAMFPEYDMEDLTLCQMYGNSDNRLKSNANYIETINGVKCHLWEMGVDDLDKQLEFYYVTAVGTGWYIIAIGVAFVVLIVLGISYAVSKKQKVVIEENKVDDSEED